MRLVKSFNQGDENYYKFETEKGTSVEADKKIRAIMKELGFTKKVFEKRNAPSGYDAFRLQTHDERIGYHEYMENDNYKVHVIFSADHLNLVVKCSEEQRLVLNRLIEKCCKIF